ncbi:MAG: 3-deoxy-D-manno-octulosonic acid transferase [Bacteroidetes bacterium]|nr:MAG: 3-deoxy-D-manno-octulosonic acid transferase [Bacteroidota bacterium]
MIFIYNILISLYSFSVRLACVFNPKARFFVKGRKNIFKNINKQIDKSQQIIWFHCASLGEFEQGRPVIEALKQKHPQYKILLTFFSPSGYEIRKNYAGADYIFYLPIDTKRNATKFIKLINPQVVFFVKYEFWYHYLNVLQKKKIPVYIFSAIFRKDQLFFKWYGGFYRKMLQKFDFLFVQNKESKELLNSININNVEITGDTRFDRVYSIASQAKTIPVIEAFKQGKTTIIAGSTWKPDEELLIKFINSENNNDLKYIIAPHEIFTENIERIEKSINKKAIRYSQADEKNVLESQVIIIDNIGMLSSLYKYGDIAYIGGGFGKGIHNVLEAATFGLPLFFGTNYKQFNEAVQLVSLKAAFVINNYSSLKNKFKALLTSKMLIKNTGEIAKKYIVSNLGATSKIVTKCEKKLAQK